MNKFSKFFISIFILISCMSCSNQKIKLIENSDSIYVRKIEDLKEDFIMGVDLSSVISLEESGVKFYDYNGNEEDIFKTLAESGVNYIRVRVWNNPYDSNGNSYGGGNCDIDNCIEIGKRASKYGLKLLVDFHYSDFWADPNKQMCPKAWQEMDIETKSNALYEFTKDCLSKLKNNNVDVGMVQLGNETNGKMAGESIWQNIIYYLMASGSKATREVYPDALIAVHFANPEKANSYYDYAKKLDYWGLDYDVFGSSYYPFWHGTLDNLKETLSTISTTYNKKVMVLETSYPYTTEDFDFNGNTISSESTITKSYPFSVQGQVNSLLDIIDTINTIDSGIGVCYWEPAWLPVGHNSYEENSILWEKYGSGWACSYASEYDPDDAGKYYGGSAVDNQALFDAYGHPLESLKVFALAKKGNIIDNRPETIEDTYIECDINGEIKLPDKVNAIYLDGSKYTVDVKWSEFDAEEIKANGTNSFEVVGYTSDMYIAICHVSLVEFNFIQNSSFEDDQNRSHIPVSWNLINNGNTNELYVEDKLSDSSHGSKHYHFWADTNNSIDFDLEQELIDLPEGTYKYSISIMGGDCENQDIYMYVKINDEIIKTCPLSITTYNNWDNNTIEDIQYDGNDKLIVGIHVKTDGVGNGAWGKIDNAMLNSVK